MYLDFNGKRVDLNLTSAHAVAAVITALVITVGVLAYLLWFPREAVSGTGGGMRSGVSNKPAVTSNKQAVQCEGQPGHKWSPIFGCVDMRNVEPRHCQIAGNVWVERVRACVPASEASRIARIPSPNGDMNGPLARCAPWQAYLGEQLGCVSKCFTTEVYSEAENRCIPK
jgi:hypothetical protein